MENSYIINILKNRELVVIGHRGAAGYVTENTLRSVKKAMDMGVDIIEVDVRGTRDKEIILLHDDNFKRVAGINVKAKDLDYKDILKRINLDGEKVPLLTDVLNLINGKVGLFIEIKEPETTKTVIKIIKDNNAVDWVGIVSFFDDALTMVKNLEPKIPTGLIYFRPPGRIFDAKKLKADIVLPRYNLATRKANELAHRLKLFVITWTINDTNLARRVISNGVDGIASDYPDKIIKLRNEEFS